MVAIIIFASYIIFPEKVAYNRNDYVLADESWTKEKGLILVAQYAKQFNVSKDSMIQIINCENRDWNPNLQSGLRYKKDMLGYKKGEREQSYGLSQIHVPAHRDISIEQAKNPDFAISYMASELSKGNGRQWTCYKQTL